MRALLGVLLVGVTALVAGAIGYQAGVSSAVASTAATAGTVVYHAGWGFPFFGFLLFPFFLFLLFGVFAFAFGGRRRWGGGPGGPGWGYGAHGYAGNPDDPRYRWVADAHRRLHEDEAAGRTSPPTPPTSSGGA